MKSIPHFRQSDSQRNCGAACLCMLLAAYKKKGKMSEVTKAITAPLRNGRPSCRNNLILKYVRYRGIPCCIVAVEDVSSSIAMAYEGGIDAVILYRQDLNTPYAHFAVVTGLDDCNVYVNDPQKDAPDGVNMPIPLVGLQERMRPLHNASQNEIVQPNTIILLSNPKQNANMSIISGNVPVFQCIAPMVKSVLVSDNNDGHWINLKDIAEE